MSRTIFSSVIALVAALVAAAEPSKVDSQYLPNAYRLTGKVLSGGQPEGGPAFERLRQLGVRTIVSVDGAQPDVETAKKYGLRYVHLPHGYDGIPEDRLNELAKAVRDLPGPIYIHCHHGMHRSPAAAAGACVVLGLLTHGEALSVLKAAGTSPNYRGLYQTVRAAEKIDAEALDALLVVFREKVDVAPMAEAMVAIEHTHDALSAMAKAGWKSLASDPDRQPAHEALLLKEHFSELLRTDEVKKQPQAFQALMRAARDASTDLESALLDELAITKDRAAAFEKVSSNCKACHELFRDVPLNEKHE